MKRLKIYPKIFFYTLGLMLFIVLVAHALLYFLTPQVSFDFIPWTRQRWPDHYRQIQFDTVYYADDSKSSANFSYLSALWSPSCAPSCSSRQITVPVKQLSVVTERMAKMDKSAVCQIRTEDEIGVLADNINGLYQNLLSAIETLEIEKQRIRELEQAKVDFMRAASHELKTPLTALNATLENMILGIGKYRDVEACLPECKEMAEQLSGMIQEILEASGAGGPLKNEIPVQTDLSGHADRVMRAV